MSVRAPLEIAREQVDPQVTLLLFGTMTADTVCLQEAFKRPGGADDTDQAETSGEDGGGTEIETEHGILDHYQIRRTPCARPNIFTGQVGGSMAGGFVYGFTRGFPSPPRQPPEVQGLVRRSSSIFNIHVTPAGRAGVLHDDQAGTGGPH
jgi:hypothetical protein